MRASQARGSGRLKFGFPVFELLILLVGRIEASQSFSGKHITSGRLSFNSRQHGGSG
jgi:hypothetical protein